MCCDRLSIRCAKPTNRPLQEFSMTRYIPPADSEVIYVSRRQIYKDSEGKDKPAMRYANMDIASPENSIVHQLATVKGETVLRETDAGRRNLRATFTETDRKIGSLDINYFTEKTGNLHPKGSVTLYGQEIEMLLNFIDSMKRVKVLGPGKLQIEPGALENPNFVKDSDVAKALKEKPDLLRAALENPSLGKDMRAIGFWRKSLKEFNSLLNEETYFEKRRTKIAGKSSEKVWQNFFENNKWIFGYGLLYISPVGASNRGLEQILQSGSLLGSGARPDGVMRTRGALSNLCLVEIKIHSTPLIEKNKRGGTYLVSKELSDAVSQCQTAVSIAEESINRKFQPVDNNGFPVSDPIFSFRPRSILVIGNLSEFLGDHGVSEERFRAFEVYRRNLICPEIVTFDELYDRARSLIEHEL